MKRAVALLVLAGVATGCTPASSPESAPIARVHKSRCGNCHAPPEPGSRSRAALEAAAERHRAQHRVALSAAEWSAMVDYLAPTSNARDTSAPKGVTPAEPH